MFERKHSRTEICFLVMHLNPLTELNNLVKIVGVFKKIKQLRESRKCAVHEKITTEAEAN